MINKLRITKPATRAEYLRCMEIAPQGRLPNLEWDACYQGGPGLLSSDFIDGVHPTNIMAIWYAAQAYMWHGDKMLPFDPKPYISHTVDVANSEGLFSNLIEDYMAGSLVDLTPVRFCHGDLTHYNCLQKPTGDIVFFDPADTYGCPCRELDESKLMQSMDGFGELFRGLPPVKQSPRFPFRPAHFAFLVSHYVRMLPHVKFHAVAYTFARQRLVEILCKPIS